MEKAHTAAKRLAEKAAREAAREAAEDAAKDEAEAEAEREAEEWSERIAEQRAERRAEREAEKIAEKKSNRMVAKGAGAPQKTKAEIKAKEKAKLKAAEKKSEKEIEKSAEKEALMRWVELEAEVKKGKSPAEKTAMDKLFKVIKAADAKKRRNERYTQSLARKKKEAAEMKAREKAEKLRRELAGQTPGRTLAGRGGRGRLTQVEGDDTTTATDERTPAQKPGVATGTPPEAPSAQKTSLSASDSVPTDKDEIDWNNIAQEDMPAAIDDLIKTLTAKRKSRDFAEPEEDAASRKRKRLAIDVARGAVTIEDAKKQIGRPRPRLLAGSTANRAANDGRARGCTHM
jgi:hypothetical protein